MIKNIGYYKYQTIVENPLVIDFPKLYDYISKEDKTDDPYFIGDDFGNNPSYYLWHALGKEIKVTENNEVDAYNREMYDEIANDFNNWIEQNRVFEGINED